MKWWEYLFPIQSPFNKPPKEEIPSLEPVIHPPIVTRRGRVVYDRKTHFFGDRDLERIAAKVLQVNIEERNDNYFLMLIEKLTIWMMTVLLSKLTGQVKAEIVSERLYLLARDFLARIIDRLLQKELEQLQSGISGGAH